MSKEKFETAQSDFENKRKSEFSNVKDRFFYKSNLWEAKKSAPRPSIHLPEEKQNEMNTQYDKRAKLSQSLNFDDRKYTWQYHRSDKASKDLRVLDNIEQAVNGYSPGFER